MSHRLIENEDHQRELSERNMKQPATTRTFKSFRPLKMALKDCGAWIKGWCRQEADRGAKDTEWGTALAPTTPS